MDIRAIIMGLTFALIWSSAFTSARIIVTNASPLAALSLRFFISGLIGISIARILRQTWHLTPNQWRATIIFGVCQNAIYLGLNFYAMQTVEASLASIIASSMPLLVAFAGWVFLKDSLSIMGILGLILGMVGVVIIMSSRMKSGIDFYGVTFCIIAAIALTIATLSIKSMSSGENLLMVVGLQMLVGAVPLTIASALTETLHMNVTAGLVTAFIYTTLAPGLLATWIWFKLVARIGATRAATFHFLNPLIGVAIAAIVLGESLSQYDIIGVIVIMVGILTVQLSRQVDR
ncbi:MAG: DMT family transporter [Tateyamaria sp.]|nr:DMT family transporter [Tateyamaria sp.]